MRSFRKELSGPVSIILKLDLLLDANPMRLALVVVIDDFQPKIVAALRERSPNFRNVRAPFPTELAEHDVLAMVVNQPQVTLQPIGSEATAPPPVPIPLRDGRLRLFPRVLQILNDGNFVRARRGPIQLWGNRQGDSRG